MSETESETRERHKRELKELQGQIQAIKKGVPKGDKKAKKRSVEEIAKLQNEIETRHEEELKLVNTPAEETIETQLTDTLVLSEEPAKKQTRADKRREAKAAANDKKLKELDMVSTEPTARSTESAKMVEVINKLGLSVYEIPADGNCMFYALQHQLRSRDIEHTVPQLRSIAAQHMREHEGEFISFLIHPETGDMLTTEQFDMYCSDMMNNGVWGGLHEAHAISSALKVPVRILQADAKPVTMGEGHGGDVITLLYYKHKFGLGEHYDSVKSAR